MKRKREDEEEVVFLFLVDRPIDRSNRFSWSNLRRIVTLFIAVSLTKEFLLLPAALDRFRLSFENEPFDDASAFDLSWRSQRNVSQSHSSMWLLSWWWSTNSWIRSWFDGRCISSFTDDNSDADETRRGKVIYWWNSLVRSPDQIILTINRNIKYLSAEHRYREECRR